MTIHTLAIDISKNIFQLHGNDHKGKCVFKKRLKRETLMQTVENITACQIVMESCMGSNYLYRKFEKMGHTVKLISPQFVKPFVKSGKNDANDAEAIAEAASRPSMRYVASKSMQQQDIQSVHRVRNRLITNRTAIANQIRGLLLEYGIVIKMGMSPLKSEIPNFLDDENSDISNLFRDLLQELWKEFTELEDRIKKINVIIKNIANENDKCKKIMKVEGIGDLTATAIYSHFGNVNVFKNGRNFSASLGLVPKQYSSGNKIKLLGITKKGDRYIRKLLVQGAISVLIKIKDKKDKKSLWIKEKIHTLGFKKAAVALANKNARIIWALLTKDEDYKIIY